MDTVLQLPFQLVNINLMLAKTLRVFFELSNVALSQILKGPYSLFMVVKLTGLLFVALFQGVQSEEYGRNFLFTGILILAFFPQIGQKLLKSVHINSFSICAGWLKNQELVVDSIKPIFVHVYLVPQLLK